jgi:hypothetical protein
MGQQTVAPGPLNGQPQKEEKKKGFWGRLFGGSEDEKQKEEQKQKEDNSRSPQPAGSQPNPR